MEYNLLEAFMVVAVFALIPFTMLWLEVARRPSGADGNSAVTAGNALRRPDDPWHSKRMADEFRRTVENVYNQYQVGGTHWSRLTFSRVICGVVFFSFKRHFVKRPI